MLPARLARAVRSGLERGDGYSGNGVSRRNAGVSPASFPDTLPHCQSLADRTKPAFTGFCSMYRIAATIMFLTPDAAVGVVLHPERPGSSQKLVRLFGTERFPRVDDAAKWKPGERFEQRMHVIGHDDPCQQAVACAVEVQQSLLDLFGDPFIPQPARAMSLSE